MKFIEGDITETELVHIAHGCNALGVMGAGVALAIARKWPEVYQDYKYELENEFTTPESALGETIVSETVDGDHVIHNLITQVNTSATGDKVARYTAVVKSLQIVIDYNLERGDAIAIPAIGCGLGGLKWSIVRELLEELEEDSGVEFHVYYLGKLPE